ncbi:MAG: PAC2 family protein [Acidobacteriota bacterium]
MNVKMLREPVQVRRAILNFSGWSDAGDTGHLTLRDLKRAIWCEPAAVIDMDGFWDTDGLRPQVTIKHGRIQKMDWPAYSLSHCILPSEEAILIGNGPEPTSNWRGFARSLLKVLKEWQCEEVVILGSMHDHIYHDELAFSGVAMDAEGLNRLHELGCEPLEEYQGPCAVHAAIMLEASEREMQAFSVWAHHPFYLSGPSELIIATLLSMLGGLLDVELDTGHLMDAWGEREREIEALIEDNDEIRQTIESMRGDRKPARKHQPAGGPAKVVQFNEFLKRRHDPSND